MKQAKEMTNIPIDINKFRTAVEGTGGVLLQIAANLGIHRKTLWDWRNLYPELVEIITEEREKTIDIAESRLIKLIKDDDVGAIKFFLSTQGKDRGYSTRTEQKIDGNLQHSGQVTVYLPDNGR